MKRKRVKSLIQRYGVGLLAFLLPVFVSVTLRRFSISFDFTLIVVVAIVFSAWYGGVGPGLLTALLVEVATFMGSSARPHSSLAAVILEVNRTGFLLVFVLLVAARKRIERQLRDQGEWLEVTLSSIGDGVIVTDLAGRITFMNPSAELITECSASQAKGLFVDQVIQIADSIQEGDFPSQLLFKSAPLSEVSMNSKEITVKSKSRVTKSVSCTSSPILGHAGRVSGSALVIRDITDQRLLEQQFLQSQKMEAVGRLAGGIAHDFNNLLTAIIGYSDLAMIQAKANPDLQKAIKEIGDAGRKAATLTSQLLAFSRRQMVQPVVIDINAVVKGIQKMLIRVIGEDIELTTICADDLGRVRADQSQLEQILMNLAVNSRDAMPNGGRLTIETGNIELDGTYVQTHAEVKPGRYVVLSISDTGHGMDHLTQSRAFEPFYTTKEQGKGTGLGLSTVYGIVKQAGGHIWLYSEPGQGAAFKIYLPRVDEAPETVKQHTDVIPPTGSETILLVEDNDSVRKMAHTALEQYGYRVIVAGTGDEAIELYQRNATSIDIVITDIVMPNMSGFDLIRILREFNDRIKVLQVSGYTEHDTTRRGLLDDGIEFLAKPFTPESLAKRVRDVLDNQVVKTS